MIALAERLLASNMPWTLATLFSACGSTYRTLGSMMVSLPGMIATTSDLQLRRSQ
jgi:xanthine/CO dehydrogenase XdhC/CoxF family maturation factor